jgi:hypothetical protein
VPQIKIKIFGALDTNFYETYMLAKLYKNLIDSKIIIALYDYFLTKLNPNAELKLKKNFQFLEKNLI